MSNIQAAARGLLIFALLAVCCSARKPINTLDDDDNLNNDRRSLVREYLDQFVDKRAAAKTVCRGGVSCSDACDQGKTYDATSTCGLTCYTDKNFGIGSTGTCMSSFSTCPGAASTFCPGGTFTAHRNGFSSIYWDCDNGYGCGDQGGCCVRIGGFDTGRNKHFCLSCNTKAA